MSRKIPTFVNVLAISDYSDNQSQAQSEANIHFLRGVSILLASRVLKDHAAFLSTQFNYVEATVPASKTLPKRSNRQSDYFKIYFIFPSKK
jgi:hypothetical protein